MAEIAFNNIKTNESTLSQFLANNQDFIEVNNKVICKICNYSSVYSSKEGLTPFIRHKKSKVHASGCIRNEIYRSNLEKGFINSEEHQKMFLKALIKYNIPFDTVENPYFIDFFESLNFNIRSRQYYGRDLLKNSY